ncbi:hypothetical protein DPEC_G00345570 [Dallia pectoralis]|uniref:Uncharacterized protein n=1 Tax=Dallia pectoralis TaxID=75939 RepID=A0ACC2F3I4_DALPE|nr:hypothetical protein DPEC_G00345570 [Dallia pectoralis]
MSQSSAVTKGSGSNGNGCRACDNASSPGVFKSKLPPGVREIKGERLRGAEGGFGNGKAARLRLDMTENSSRGLFAPSSVLAEVSGTAAVQNRAWWSRRPVSSPRTPAPSISTGPSFTAPIRVSC